MVKIEDINKICIMADDLQDFMNVFNHAIREFGSISVYDTLIWLHLVPEEFGCGFVDSYRGWTRKINAKEHFKIEYAKYGDRMPHFRLNLPDIVDFYEEKEE